MLLFALIALLVALFLPLGGSEPGPVYTVVRGDSLSVIARREALSVAQLRSWNGIDGDLIEVGQQLAVGPPVEGESWTLAQWLSRRFFPASEPEGNDGLGPTDGFDDPTATRARSPRKKRRRAGSGRTGAGPDPGVLGQEGEEQSAPEPSWKPLSMPAPRPCLAADAGIGDGSFGRSIGLDAEQVSAAVISFQDEALRCYSGRETAEGEVLLHLVVGCDGRVLRSAVKSDSTGAAGFAVCVADVMRHAPFPVHARDEVELTVPMHFVADINSN